MNVRTGAVLALLVPKMRGEVLCQFSLVNHQTLTLGVSDMSGVKTAVGHPGITRVTSMCNVRAAEALDEIPSAQNEMIVQDAEKSEVVGQDNEIGEFGTLRTTSNRSEDEPYLVRSDPSSWSCWTTFISLTPTGLLGTAY
jgi:hypothetical protein